MDEIDLKLLRLLQKNARTPMRIGKIKRDMLK